MRLLSNTEVPPSLLNPAASGRWSTGQRAVRRDLWDAFRLLRSTKNWLAVGLARFGLTRPKFILLRSGVRLLYERRLTALEVFLEQPYRPLNVMGRAVLDVGAYTGDSALYFSIRGAKTVYALEPVPRIYKMAVMNLQLNGVRNVILRNEAIGGVESVISVDPNQNVLLTHSGGDFDGGTPVRVRTLDTLVNELGLDDAILKLDCEGTEYEVLDKADSATFEHFREMCIEVHPVENWKVGVAMIAKRLSGAGFRCKVIPNHVYGVTWLLYATRSDKSAT